MNSVKGVCAPQVDSEDMLISRLVEHEGIKRFAYKDSLDYTTIGIGRCIEPMKGRGLSIDECFYLLRNDLADCRKDLKAYDWFTIQDEVRADALVELCFNMGLAGLEFEHMLGALKRKSYPEAAKCLLDSQWKQQVSEARSKDLASRIYYGRYK